MMKDCRPLTVASATTREHNLEAVFEIAQVAALVIEHVERNVGPCAHHEIMGCTLHQDFLDAAQELQRHRRN